MSTPAPGRARTSSLALSTAVVEETVGSVSDACCHPVTNGGNGKQENSGLKHRLGKEGPDTGTPPNESLSIPSLLQQGTSARPCGLDMFLVPRAAHARH